MACVQQGTRETQHSFELGSALLSGFDIGIEKGSSGVHGADCKNMRKFI